MRTRLTVLFGFLGSITCGDRGGGSAPVDEEDFAGAMAAAICDLVHTQCMCEDTSEPDLETCLAATTEEWQTMQDEAQMAGLTYDPACAGDYTHSYDELGCKTLSELTQNADPDECGGCSPYHGDVPDGQPCTSAGSFSDCRSGLFCLGGVCEDPCTSMPILDEGEACVDATGDPVGLCNPFDDLYCDGAVCQRAPAIGQPCPVGECERYAVCSEMQVCVAAPGIGEPCPDQVCAEGAQCDNAVCAEEQPLVCLFG